MCASTARMPEASTAKRGCLKDMVTELNTKAKASILRMEKIGYNEKKKTKKKKPPEFHNHYSWPTTA